MKNGNLISNSKSATFYYFYCIFQLFQKVAEISNVQIFVTDFCTFYKKSLKKSLIFEKFLQEFSHIPKADYLPVRRQTVLLFKILWVVVYQIWRNFCNICHSEMSRADLGWMGPIINKSLKSFLLNVYSAFINFFPWTEYTSRCI